MASSQECRFGSADACNILDMDYFLKTLSGIKAKGGASSPDLLGSIIVHYVSKWLPDLTPGDHDNSTEQKLAPKSFRQESPTGSITATWMKKRFFVETLVGILVEECSIPIHCDFLLRLLRVANMVSADPACRAELERRVACRLEEASLEELMIPSYCYTCGTVLDVELVIRLVRRFMNLEVGTRSGAAALVKVARLVDSYLAEAAVDTNLKLPEFISLAGALPAHARALDDGLYRAIDTFLKAHPSLSKQERKTLCRLIDSGKLSPEGSLHAAQNERLPVRAAIQVLHAEQTKLYKHLGWSGGSFGSHHRSQNGKGLSEPLGQSIPKHLAGWSGGSIATAQQTAEENKRLREDVARLQSQCNAMQEQIERLLEKKKGFWRKLGMPSALKSNNAGSTDQRTNISREAEEGDALSAAVYGRQTPDMKAKLVKAKPLPKRWRQSVS